MDQMPQPHAVAAGSASGTRCSRSSASTARAVNAERIATQVVTLAPWSKATRAATWLAPNMVAITSSSTTPSLGDKIALMRKVDAYRVAGFCQIAAVVLAAAANQAAACTMREDDTTYRRSVTRVQTLPETEAWSAAALRNGSSVQYVLLPEQTRYTHGRCHWTVEARADGELWRRFFVSPDGKSVLVEDGDGRPAQRAP